jgi:hypothetical protein
MTKVKLVVTNLLVMIFYFFLSCSKLSASQLLGSFSLKGAQDLLASAVQTITRPFQFQTEPAAL